MGAGLAKEFKKLFGGDGLFDFYREACNDGRVAIGRVLLWDNPIVYPPGCAQANVLLFPTKDDWRNPSKYEYVESGLNSFCSDFTLQNRNDYAFPMLGCGFGGLDWSIVKPIMTKYLSAAQCYTEIYET